MVSDFRVSFSFFHKTDPNDVINDRIDHFMMYTLSSGSLRGGTVVNHDADTWLDVKSATLSPDAVLSGLRMVRARRAEGKGVVEVAGPLPNGYARERPTLYEKGALSDLWAATAKDTREAINCPCLVAIIAYVEGGDETDLFAALDMLYDAGKFDTV